MTEKEDSSSGAEELTGKLDQILQRLDFVEKLILEKPEYAGLVASLELTKVGVGLYGESLKIASRLKAERDYLRQKPVVQNGISGCIIHAKLIAHQREVYCGENVHLEIHLANRGNSAALSLKVEGIIPKEFELVERPEKWMIEEGCVSFVEGKLGPLETTEIKLTLKSKKKGEFILMPRIQYMDETGEPKSCELEQVQIKVKELGIRGWLRGE